MRGFLIGQWHGAACLKLASGFAFHQHCKAPHGQCQFGFLTGHDVRQFVDCAGQVGDLFFKMCCVGHGLLSSWRALQRKERLLCAVAAGGILSFFAKMIGGAVVCHGVRLCKSALPRRVSRVTWPANTA